MRAPTRITLLTSVGAVVTALTVVAAPLTSFAAESAVTAASDSVKPAKKNAKVSAKGAAVKLPLVYTCTAKWQGYISVSLVQAVGNGFASSSSWKSVKCTGKAKAVTLYLQASPGQGAKAFEKGTASLVGSIDSSDPSYNPCEEFDCTEGVAPIARAQKMPPPTGNSIFTSASTPLVIEKQVPHYKHAEFHETIKIGN